MASTNDIRASDDCTITFTKTADTVGDPDGRCILKSWWEREGPWLWHFPLKASKPSLPVPAAHEIHEELGPRVSAVDFSQPMPAAPINVVTPSPSVPLPGSSRGLPAAPSEHSLHPSQGIHYPCHWPTRQSLLCPLPLWSRAGHGLGSYHLQHNF